MRFIKPVLLLLLVPMAALVSCSKSKEDIKVAQVQDRVITLAEYEDTYYKMDPKYIPGPEEPNAREDFLDILINKEVMALKADELGYDKDQFVIDGMKAFRAVGLQAGYLKVKVADKINVTEDDLREAYKLYGTNLQIKQILVDTKEEADEVIAAIRDEGGDFETVCKRYSKGPDAADGGQLVNALYGTFPPEFQEELFSTPVGDITNPILSRYGYFVIKVVSKNRPTQKSFEEARPDLEKLVSMQQQIRLQNEMSEKIRADYGFQWYDDGIRIFFDALPPDRPLTSPPDRSTEVYPLLQFDAADLEKPMVEYKNKVLTIKDVSDLYDRASFFQRPRREYRWGGVRKFLLDVIMNELINDVLTDSEIEKEPQVAALLQRKREQLMVDKLYQDLVDAQTEATYQEINTYYQDNKEGFRRNEERRFGAILCGDRATADELAQKLKNGYPFEKACMEYSIEDVNRANPCGTGFITKTENAEIGEVGFALGRVGAVSEPFNTSKGWMVLKYFERRPERVLSLEEAQDDIRRYLKQQKNEERLNELLEKWRAEYSVQVFEKNLKKADLHGERRRAVSFS